MRISFFGTPDFAVPSLKALIESGEEITCVITQPDRAKGRGHRVSAPPVKELALSKGIPVVQPADIRSTSFFEEISGLKPELIVVVAYGKIIPAAILNLPPHGCINVHASLLPKYRGAAPIQWVLINGEKKTGITTMLMDEGLDTGDILLQVETEIIDNDTAYTLGIRLSEIGASLLIKTVNGLKDNSVKPKQQTGESSFAPILKKEDGRIDWSLPAQRIIDLIRGTFPWPGAYCYLNGERITIIKAETVFGSSTTIPGMIEKVSHRNLYTGTGKGLLSILEIKPEGKKAMPITAFLHGRHLREGMHFDAS